MFNSFYLDNSNRTKQIQTPFKICVITLIVAVISLFWIIGSTIRYNWVVESSSTPIGTQLKFERSNAQIKLSGIYTDKKNDVLIARLTPEDNGNRKLPFKGKDYKIFIYNNGLISNSKMPILFGRLSTDGDMFLVIPKPLKTVYSIFIYNTKYVDTGKNLEQSTTLDNDNNIARLGEENISKSITKALSNFNYTDVTTSNAYKIEGNENDVISFRLGLAPILDTKDYKPVKINERLLDNNVFNFEKFFNAVFKKYALKVLNNKYEYNSDRMRRLKDTQEEYNERLAQNPDDTDAQNGLQEVESNIERLDKDLEDILKQKQEYVRLGYNPKMFSNILTKAKTI